MSRRINAAQNTQRIIDIHARSVIHMGYIPLYAPYRFSVA
jgi:hypothetical protein